MAGMQTAKMDVLFGPLAFDDIKEQYKMYLERMGPNNVRVLDFKDFKKALSKD